MEESAKIITPRHMRTPEEDALTVICHLTEHFNKIAEMRGDKPFIENIIAVAWNDETASGDSLIDRMEKELGRHQYNAPYALVITCTYAVQTHKAFLSENPEDRRQAWSFAADARYWHGIVTGYNDNDVKSWLVISDRGSKNAQNPRPKTKKTNRSLTIKEMRNWRKDGNFLEDFIDAAKNKSIYELKMEEFEKENKRKFKLSWDCSDIKIEEQILAFKTLEEWWGKAV